MALSDDITPLKLGVQYHDGSLDGECLLSWHGRIINIDILAGYATARVFEGDREVAYGERQLDATSFADGMQQIDAFARQW